MKHNYIIIIIVLFVIVVPFELSAQKEETKKTETTEFKVEGVCNMCKTRIENAAIIKGVKLAEWNKETSILKVIYRTDKISINDIHKAIARAGHDTNKDTATNESYNKLPECCAYRGNVQKH